MSVEGPRDAMGAMAEPIKDYETPLDEQDVSEIARSDPAAADPLELDLDYTSEELNTPTEQPPSGIDANDGTSGIIAPRYHKIHHRL